MLFEDNYNYHWIVRPEKEKRPREKWSFSRAYETRVKHIVDLADSSPVAERLEDCISRHDEHGTGEFLDCIKGIMDSGFEFRFGYFTPAEPYEDQRGSARLNAGAIEETDAYVAYSIEVLGAPAEAWGCIIFPGMLLRSLLLIG